MVVPEKFEHQGNPRPIEFGFHGEADLRFRGPERCRDPAFVSFHFQIQLDADQATMLLAEIKSAPVDVIESEERLLDRRWVCAGV